MCLFSLSLFLSPSHWPVNTILESTNRKIEEERSRSLRGRDDSFFFPLLLFAIKVTEYPSKKLRCVSDTYLTGEPLIDGSMDQPAN